MAFKNFSKLSSRSQSSLVSQVHQLISYYSEIFCPRERVYIKNLSKLENSIYWLEDDERKLVATAIVDPNYMFNVSGLKIQTLGHTISKRPGQMDRILNHVFDDYKNNSVIMLCRPVVANALQTDAFNLTQFSPKDILEKWPELAKVTTDYFNTTKESLFEGMERKQHNLFLKLSESDKIALSKTKPNLVDFLHQKVIAFA